MPRSRVNPVSARGKYLLKTYGITLTQYSDLLKKQNGCCAICDKHHTKEKKSLAVDHNHVSGVIRGLLCSYCNHRRIGRHRDPGLLRRMAAYLERDTGFVVPKRKKRRK